MQVIAQQNKMTAINSAIEVDLTGQVSADSIGSRIYSGFGGQVDFMTGAARAEDGKAIIALQSRTRRGIPRIVPFIREGGGVVTTRGHVQYVVTEYGIACLQGRTINERAKELINIAHPQDRDFLKATAKKMGLM